MKKIIALLISMSIASVGLINPVSAKEICYTQYGGGETCINTEDDAKIEVDKKISKSDSNYTDHIKSSEFKFEQKDKIYFKITVKNKGDVDLKSVELKDNLPDFVEFEKMIEGNNPDESDNTLEWDLGTIKKGESETIKFIVKVVKESDLPADDKICLTNVAKATGKRSDNNEKESDADYSNFCIDLPSVLGDVKELPKAGNFSSIYLAVVGLFSTVGGVLFRKKISK